MGINSVLFIAFLCFNGLPYFVYQTPLDDLSNHRAEMLDSVNQAGFDAELEYKEIDSPDPNVLQEHLRFIKRYGNDELMIYVVDDKLKSPVYFSLRPQIRTILVKKVPAIHRAESLEMFLKVYQLADALAPRRTNVYIDADFPPDEKTSDQN